MLSGFYLGVMATSNRVDRAEEVSLMVTIIEAIAEREEVDALELSPPLFDAIDPEIVELLSNRPADDGLDGARLQFSYQGYQITLDRDDVRIRPE